MKLELLFYKFLYLQKIFNLTFEELNKSIKNRKFSPLYLLHGEEPYYIDLLVDVFANEILTDVEKEFNQNIFYGKDSDPKVVMSACLQYPMMSDHRLVILKEAQDMELFEDLHPVILNPADSTILVIVFRGKKVDRRLKIIKDLESKGVVFESERLYENKIPAWIKNHAKSLGLNVSDIAAEHLSLLLSNDLQKIDNELQKLKISTPVNKTIDAEDVKNKIGMSRGFSVFELNNAIGEGHLAKALKIVEIFSFNPNANPNVLTISSMFKYFTQLLICSENLSKTDVDLGKLMGVNSFFIKSYRNAAKIYPRKKIVDVITLLKEYDLKSKGVDSKNIDQIELIKELVLKIMIPM
jgi:DNA polymerase-3 subunit delta